MRAFSYNYILFLGANFDNNWRWSSHSSCQFWFNSNRTNNIWICIICCNIFQFHSIINYIVKTNRGSIRGSCSCPDKCSRHNFRLNTRWFQQIFFLSYFRCIFLFHCFLCHFFPTRFSRFLTAFRTFWRCATCWCCFLSATCYCRTTFNRDCFRNCGHARKSVNH